MQLDGAPNEAVHNRQKFDDHLDSSPELLCDLPILDVAQDYLGYNAYAEALAELIDSSSVATPLTLSIDAPWGAGKTSLARLVECKVCEWPKVRGDRPHVVCWFNAWMHSDAPNLGPALAAAVGKTVARHRHPWRRLVSPVPMAMLSPEERRRRRVVMLACAAVAALIIAFGLPALHEIFSFSTQTRGLIGAGVLAGVPIAASLWIHALGVAQATASFVGDPQSQAGRGSMADVATQFATLVRSATRRERRLVIFIDDLDRCPPERAMQICETASLLLSVPDVVIVLIGDVAALRNFARSRFSAAHKDGSRGKRASTEDYGRSYFDKIVQLDFALPPPDRSELAAVLGNRSGVSTPSGIQADSANSAAGLSRTERQDSLGMRRVRKYLAPVARAYDFVQARPRRLAAFFGITFGVWMVIGVIFGEGTSQESTGTGHTIVGIVGTVMFISWLGVGGDTVRRRLRNRSARKSTVKVDETIRGHGGNLTDTVKEAVEQSVASASSRLIEQRVRRASVERLVSAGSSELAAYLPGLPRSVKRVANRHYLLASVAVSRKMIGGTPPLTAEHLSKWAVMMERWPDLAEQIVEQPRLADQLEQCARIEELSAREQALRPLLERASVSQRDDADLVRLLRDQTSIAAIVDRLVFARPAGSLERLAE